MKWWKVLCMTVLSIAAGLSSYALWKLLTFESAKNGAWIEFGYSWVELIPIVLVAVVGVYGYLVFKLMKEKQPARLLSSILIFALAFATPAIVIQIKGQTETSPLSGVELEETRAFFERIGKLLDDSKLPFALNMDESLSETWHPTETYFLNLDLTSNDVRRSDIDALIQLLPNPNSKYGYVVRVLEDGYRYFSLSLRDGRVSKCDNETTINVCEKLELTETMK
jgi:hypothetical protein